MGGGGTIDASTGAFTAGRVAGEFKDTVRAEVGSIFAVTGVKVLAGAPAKARVTPPSVTVAPNGKSAFSAQVFDAFDNPSADPVTWSVTDARAGSIASTGDFTAGTLAAAFTDVVVATAGSAVAKATVNVIPGAAAKLTLTPGSAQLRPTEQVKFAVEATDAFGNTFAPAATFAVLHGGGDIATDGTFTAGKKAGGYAGTVQAQAAALAVVADVTVLPGPAAAVTVTPSHPTLKTGESLAFSASVADAFGNPLANAPRTWSSAAAAGTVGADGVFTAGSSPGDFADAVVAESGGVRGSASVTVEARPCEGDACNSPAPSPEPEPEPPPAAPVVGCACDASGEAAGPMVLLFGIGLAALRRRPRRR